MIEGGNLDYASARVRARHGARLTERDWERVEAIGGLAECLDALRTTSLARWAAPLDSTDDSHGLERALRAQWRRYVDEVASWHPIANQPWLVWLAWLPSLSLIAQFARPEPAPAWLLADPLLGPLAAGEPLERSTAMERTALAPLVPGVRAAQPLLVLWQAQWRRLAPRREPMAREVDTSGTRESAGELARLYRACAGTIVASACHLLMLALDLERLRGILVIRCLFGRTARAEGA